MSIDDARRRDRQAIHHAHRRRAGLRRAHDRLQRQRPGLRRRRIEMRSGDELAGALEPVLREAGLQRPHRRPLDPDLQIAPVLVVLRVAGPVIGNAGAAGEADAAVDDQRLAMRAVVDAPQVIPADRVVPRDMAAAVVEDPQDLVADARRADRIEQDLDADAARRRGGQRAREGQPDLAGPVDVGLDGDRVARPARSPRASPGRTDRRCSAAPASCPRRNGTPAAPAIVFEELGIADGQSVIEAVLRRELDRRGQRTDAGPEADAKRRPPVALIDEVDARAAPTATTTRAGGECASTPSPCLSAWCAADPEADDS